MNYLTVTTGCGFPETLQNKVTDWPTGLTRTLWLASFAVVCRDFSVSFDGTRITVGSAKICSKCYSQIINIPIIKY